MVKEKIPYIHLYDYVTPTQQVIFYFIFVVVIFICFRCACFMWLIY